MAQNDDALEKASRREIYLRAGALIADPTSIPDLAERIEREAIPREGVPFDTRHTTEERVSCALCGRKRNHFRGFVVTFADGRRAIVGRDCGEQELFDQGAWKAMAAKAEQKKLQVLYEARSAPAIEAIDKLLPKLVECEACIVPLTDFLADVATELSDLYSPLLRAAGRGGELTRHMDRMVTVRGADGREREVIQSERRVFASVPSELPFKKDGLRSALLRVRLGVERARKLLDQANVTMAQQSEAFSLLRQLSAKFEEVASEAQQAKRYLSPDYWKGVAKWANADPYRFGNFRVSKSGIRHVESDELFGEVRFPSEGHFSIAPFEAARAVWPRL